MPMGVYHQKKLQLQSTCNWKKNSVVSRIFAATNLQLKKLSCNPLISGIFFNCKWKILVIMHLQLEKNHSQPTCN
jgi:hypothetical protein